MKLIFYLFFSFFITSLNAQSNDPFVYAEVDGWTMGVIPNLNYGCYASSPIYEGGSMLSIYMDNRDEQKLIFLHLVNPKWSSLKIGDIHPMSVVLEPFSDKWNGDAKVVSYGDHKGIEFDVPIEFLTAFGSKNQIIFNYKAETILSLSLNGNENAIIEVMSCQVAMNDYLENPNASSSKGKLPTPSIGQSKTDPFR